MARSGLKAFVRVVGKISREIERNQKRNDRLRAQQLREEERARRLQDKEWVKKMRRQEKEARALDKERVQAFVKAGQDALAERCSRRAALRDSLLQTLFV